MKLRTASGPVVNWVSIARLLSNSALRALVLEHPLRVPVELVELVLAVGNQPAKQHRSLRRHDEVVRRHIGPAAIMQQEADRAPVDAPVEVLVGEARSAGELQIGIGVEAAVTKEDVVAEEVARRAEVGPLTERPERPVPREVAGLGPVVIGEDVLARSHPSARSPCLGARRRAWRSRSRSFCAGLSSGCPTRTRPGSPVETCGC